MLLDASLEEVNLPASVEGVIRIGIRLVNEDHNEITPHLGKLPMVLAYMSARNNENQFLSALHIVTRKM